MLILKSAFLRRMQKFSNDTKGTMRFYSFHGWKMTFYEMRYVCLYFDYRLNKIIILNKK